MGKQRARCPVSVSAEERADKEGERMVPRAAVVVEDTVEESEGEAAVREGGSGEGEGEREATSVDVWMMEPGAVKLTLGSDVGLLPFFSETSDAGTFRAWSSGSHN